MVKILGFLSLLVLGGAAPEANHHEDIDAIKVEEFNKANTTEATNSYTSTIAPPVILATSHKHTTCTTDDERPGHCIDYFLCNSNNSIITDGAGVIDIKVGKNTLPLGGDDIMLTEDFALPISREFRSNYSHPTSPDGKCLSYLDVCCVLDDVQIPEDSTPPPAIQPQHEGCGWRNPNGDFDTIGSKVSDASLEEFPWTVAVVKFESVDDELQHSNMYVGGGSLIHPSIVLTVAHYVTNAKTLRVRAGEWDRHVPKEIPQKIHDQQVRDVQSVEIHEDFNSDNLFYDIALLFLNSPMNLTPNVGIACLPPVHQRVPDGTHCLASGWSKGKINGIDQVILKKVELKVVENSKCEGLLRQTRLGSYFQLHKSFTCASGLNGADTCKKDGGSPLACPIEYKQDRYVLSGVTAWGIGCGHDNIPGVYVDVSTLRNWVDEKVKDKGFETKVYTY